MRAGIVYLSYLCSYQGIGTATVALYRCVQTMNKPKRISRQSLYAKHCDDAMFVIDTRHSNSQSSQRSTHLSPPPSPPLPSRLEPDSASATLVSSTVVDALSSRCFNYKTIAISNSVTSASASTAQLPPVTKRFPQMFATRKAALRSLQRFARVRAIGSCQLCISVSAVGNFIIEIVLERAERREGKIVPEGRMEKFKVLSVAAF